MCREDNILSNKSSYSKESASIFLKPRKTSKKSKTSTTHTVISLLFYQNTSNPKSADRTRHRPTISQDYKPHLSFENLIPSRKQKPEINFPCKKDNRRRRQSPAVLTLG